MPQTSRAFDPAPHPGDRRHAPRTPACGGAMVTLAEGSEPSRLGRVELIDTSRAGIGARAKYAVAPGTRFSLFPDDPYASVAHGKVARCEPDAAGGFRLGFQRLRRHAA